MVWPWQDGNARLSPVRAAALLLAALPALWIGWQALNGLLGPRPVTAAIHQSGDWAMRLLVATLFITPLRRLLHWPKLIGARQIFGLASAGYAFAHLALYAMDQKFDLLHVAGEIARRIYLGIGSMALIGLMILTATSGRSAVRRLGGAEWTRLHRLVHPVAALALLHFFIQSRLDVTEPLLLSGLLLWLWGYRWMQKHASVETGALAGLAVTATLGTLFIQLGWYGLATRVRVSAILEGMFDFSYEINIVWIVFGITLLLALARVFTARFDPATARASRGRSRPAPVQPNANQSNPNQFPGVQA